MPATFAHAYRVTFTSPSTYRLTDGSAGGQVNPVDAGAVTIDDPDHVLQGAGDTLTSTLGAGSYIGVVSTVSGVSGFIIQAGGSYYFVTGTALPAGIAPGQAAFSGAPNPNTATYVCFMAGTMIATPDGERAIETLKSGDAIVAADGKVLEVNWVGRQTVSKTFADPIKVLPIRIRAGALGDNLPARDLLVSPEHAMYLDGILVQAGALVNGVTIVRESDVPETFNYYHIETAEHALLLAEGAPAETFVDNVDRRRFDNWDERQPLLAYGDRIIEMNLPRAKASRQVPPALRARLDMIAGIVAARAA